MAGVEFSHPQNIAVEPNLPLDLSQNSLSRKEGVDLRPTYPFKQLDLTPSIENYSGRELNIVPEPTYRMVYGLTSHDVAEITGGEVSYQVGQSVVRYSGDNLTFFEGNTDEKNGTGEMPKPFFVKMTEQGPVTLDVSNTAVILKPQDGSIKFVKPPTIKYYDGDRPVYEIENTTYTRGVGIKTQFSELSEVAKEDPELLRASRMAQNVLVQLPILREELDNKTRVLLDAVNSKTSSITEELHLINLTVTELREQFDK